MTNIIRRFRNVSEDQEILSTDGYGILTKGAVRQKSNKGRQDIDIYFPIFRKNKE